MNGVIICVEVHLCMTDDTTLEMFVEGKSDIVLQGTLRYEVGIAHIGIVKVVEGRHAETLLHVCSHREECALEGVYIHEEGWGEFRE